MSANETQVGGQHYKAEFQHWDLVWVLGLNYFLGQVTKYISRWRLKNGVQDLKKALHFAEKYCECCARWRDYGGAADLESLRLALYAVPPFVPDHAVLSKVSMRGYSAVQIVQAFLDAQPQLGAEERALIMGFCTISSAQHLDACIAKLQQFIADMEAEQSAGPCSSYVNQDKQ